MQRYSFSRGSSTFLAIFVDEFPDLPVSSTFLAIFMDELAVLPSSSMILAIFVDEFPVLPSSSTFLAKIVDEPAGYTVFHRSTRVRAAMASTMTGVRRAKQVSWRPGMPDLAMLAVGLNATRNTMGLPLVMPPLMPPA